MKSMLVWRNLTFMAELLETVIRAEDASELRRFVGELYAHGKRYLLHNDIQSAYRSYCERYRSPADEGKFDALDSMLRRTQEIILEEDSLCAVVRPRMGVFDIYRLQRSDLSFTRLTVSQLLEVRDRFVGQSSANDGAPLEINFKPFYDYTPLVRDVKLVGHGAQVLNRFLSSKLFADYEAWQASLFRFLSLHSYAGKRLMINERIADRAVLVYAIDRARSYLDSFKAAEPYENVRFALQNFGFEPGWGNTVGRIRETLNLLDGLIASPDPETLEAFLERIPMIFRVVLVSPHGWFAQEGVIGRPDSGGQIVYVLNQARALAARMHEDAKVSGLDSLGCDPKVIVLTRLIPEAEGTPCDRRLEQIYGSQNAWILRVPFRAYNPAVTQKWISRFEIWPYLETFAMDAQRQLVAELGGTPDLVVGNYSDGNLVAYLLSRQLGQTLVCIAHALEKAKYLFSDVYWREFEPRYHFSLQFTADLIAANAANLIVSSSYQEIAGTRNELGQYESYKNFSLPGLYHVLDGIELFSPKFNIVPPGVDDAVFFPYTQTQGRIESSRERLERLLFTLDDPAIAYGRLDDLGKAPLLSMARLDRIKNLTGLAECFGRSERLRKRCNLILIAGKLHAEQSDDDEERGQIEQLRQIIDKYKLDGSLRWLGLRLSKDDSGEVYRIIADHRGAFVQPALFEAFGLTVLEAMISGLPTFATRFGGPREIIDDEQNGFWINPTDPNDMAERIADFYQRCDEDPKYWETISTRAISRVYENYTWPIHTKQLLALSKVYGFWNFTSREEREDLHAYLDMMFHLLYKPRAERMLAEHMAR